MNVTPFGSIQQKEKLADARNAAKIAWDKKEYEKVVKALTPAMDLLSKSDLMRLEISRKKAILGKAPLEKSVIRRPNATVDM